MIRSIRRFLLVSLFISIAVASSITAIGNYLLDRQVIQPYLDEKLIKFLDIIEALNQSTDFSPRVEAAIVSHLKEIEEPSTPQHLLYQVWSKDGKLLLHSDDQFFHSLLNVPLGFSDSIVKGEDWRIYASFDKKTQSKVIVAELYDIRYKLIDEIARNNAYILLVTYPVFALLIWLIVGLALRSITRVTTAISDRASTYLEPVDAQSIPIEIKPLVSELNELFGRLKLAFNRNKRFAADAAHELRTPLAAVKTQAQVALRAENSNDRDSSLHKVIQGVDRSSHVVAQLLTLSRLSQEQELNDITNIDMHKLAAEIIAYLVPIALEKNIEIELVPPQQKMIIPGNDIALGVLIRNIVDNAIRYTPPNGQVRIELLDANENIILRVSDTGPGIPTELRERVFERFFRILGTTASGSGLGLAIVSQITELHHGHINLGTPANGIGLQFDVILPKNTLVK